MKRITKILMLTFIFTMFITSTCFASYSNGTFTDSEITALKDFYKSFMTTKNQTALIDDNIIIIPTSSNTGANAMIYAVGDGTIIGQLSSDGTSIKVSTVQRVYARVSTDNYGVSTAVEKDWYNSSYVADLSISNISYTSTYIYDSEGNQIFPVPEEEEVPDIGGDIMGGETTLSFPEHEYTYWEGVIHENNGTTYAVLLVSNDSFSADNFLFLEGSGDVQDKIRFYAEAEDTDTNYFVRTYVLQPDGTWLFGSGSSYTGTSMAHNFNVGTVVMTTKNIENVDGTIFFPLTPAETLEGLGAKIVEAMAKITIVAVSCLVLLISLQVLLRVLKIYLA